MIAVLTILAFAVLLDLMFSGGEGVATIFRSITFRPRKTKTVIEVMTDKISEINYEIEDLEDELSEAIAYDNDRKAQAISSKIITKKLILSSYLKTLDKLDNNI